MPSRSPFRSALTVLILAFALMNLWISPSSASQETEPLLQILRLAGPPPVPSPELLERINAGSPDSLPGAFAGHDLLTGASAQQLLPVPPPEVEVSVDTSGAAVRASQPTAIYDSIQFPFRTVFKLLVRYNVFGIDYYYVCSAVSAGEFHLLTAGNCVYNHDPNGDGFTSDAAFMTEAWAWAAQTDRVGPLQLEDFPFGLTQPIYTRAPTSWINSASLDDDWAILTLNRRVGAHTGWMAWESGVQASALNFTGYPVEPPYVPAGTLFQYFGFDANNVTGYTAGRIGLDALVYGGHGGGPVWRYTGTDHLLQGVISTTNRTGYAEATRLNNDDFSAISGIIAEDESVRPPVARPELIEYQFETDAKDLLDNVAAPGGTFRVEYNVLNVGHANSGAVQVDFYLSDNPILSVDDTYLGSTSPGALDAFTFLNPTVTLTVPPSQPSGTYWVGWVLNGSVAEYSVFDNAAIIDNETLTVSSQGGGPDIRVEPLELRFDGNSTPSGDPIFVELDWMADGSHSHQPSQTVIDTITQTFARAGYDIRITVSNAIPHQQVVNIQNSPSSSPEVQAIMNQHFQNRNDSRYFYSIWGHGYSYQGGPTGSSGISDLPGRVHLVTLGSFPNQTGTTSHQVGTFIHEFGHSIGQKHGGSDHSNFKPNYMGVMNYHYQLEGIGPSLVAKGFANNGSGFDDFAYSHGQAAALDENNLNESAGIGLGKAVDWNCNGTIQSGVSADLNASDWCSTNGSRELLRDFDNWSDIRTYIRTSSSPLRVRSEPSQICIGWQEHRKTYEKLQELGVSATFAPSVDKASVRGGSATVERTFTVYNDGTSTLNVTSIALSSPASWINWSPSGAFSIAPGDSRPVTVSVDVSQAGSGGRTLVIQSNDANESPYPGGVSLVVVGQGIGPEILIDGFENGDFAAWD